MNHKPVKTAVVTGGHAFDVIGFSDMFAYLPGVQAYIQHMDDFSSSSEEIRDRYDVVLFYSFLQDIPEDDGLPWYAGKPRSALEHLGASGQGLVILHHALLAYRGWTLWEDVVGINDRGFDYFPDQQLRVQIEDTDHPICNGLSDWDIVDETYTMGDAGPGNHVLLTTDHPNSMRTIAWTRPYRNARVFCFESGHDHKAYNNVMFQKVLTRGIIWAAGRL